MMRLTSRSFQMSALCLLFTSLAAAQEKVLRWHDNLDRGVAAARQSGKPLFVVFRCVR